jgi:LPS-assembly protein
MLRVLVLSFVIISLAIAGLQERTYQLHAPLVYTVDDKVVAEGGVVIYNIDSTFSAQKVVYDQNSSILELIGDVYVDYKGEKQTKNEYLKIDLKDKRYEGDKLFLSDAMSDLWIKSKRGNSYNGKYRLRDAIVSSCSVDDPDWHFDFKKGVYNSNKEYVSLTHPTFYFKDVPIFYFPWIAFPTIDKRTTGLLRPYFGFENSENLLFVQPIFIAPAKNWDIELDPQIRLNRGVGLYSKFRFVDTNHSFGSVGFGIFGEQRDYVKEHNLKNDIHKGVEVKYQNSRLLSNYLKDKKYRDALLFDFTSLNDIDFINLKHDGKLAVNKLVTSKANYYITDSDEYLGLYAKYFIDTEKLDNKDTLQTLPSFQYHKFTKNLFIDNFLYSIDYKFKNSYREKGLRARQHEVALPIIYNKVLLNEYVNFSASENLYYSRVYYYEGNSTTKDANYFSNYHKLTLSSDLSKKYDDFIHNMQIGVSYIIPSFDNKNGYFADFIPFNVEQKSVRLKFNEYLYDNDGFNFLTHRISQDIYLENRDNTLDDLENEFIYKFSKDFYIQNTVVYSHEYDKLKKIQSGLYYNDAYKSFKVNHTFQEAPNLDKISFLTADFSKKVDRHYELFGGLDYDFDNDFTKEWRIGWRMKKKCWDYQFRFIQSVTPNLTSAGAESITRRGIYLYVRLANIGGVELKSEKDFALER